MTDATLAATAADELEARAIRYAAEHSTVLPRTRIGLASLLADAYLAGANSGAELIKTAKDTQDAIAAAQRGTA